MHKLTAIFKIGTDALCKKGLPNKLVLDPFVRQIATLRHEGHNVVIVSSGAVEVGLHKMGKKRSPWLTPLDKAEAAGVGQPILIDKWYNRYLEKHGLCAVQTLLENMHFSMKDNQPRYNFRDLLMHTFASHVVVPVLNENDPASRVELIRLDQSDPNKIADNDMLAASVGNLVDADIIVTVSTDCVHTKHPKEVGAEPIPFINLACPNHNIEGLGIMMGSGSKGGTGSMDTKVDSHASFIHGGPCGKRSGYVISAKDVIENEGILRAVRGEEVGTHIVCRKVKGTRPVCVPKQLAGCRR